MGDKVHDTGGGSPRVHTSNKRNLSNSSTSPKFDEKNKSKIFVTPNRYAALDSDDLNDSVFNTPTNSLTAPNEEPAPVNQDIESLNLNKPIVRPKAPPFYISNITNFSAFTKELTRITNPNGFTCKSTTSYLIVYSKDIKNYNSIMKHLEDTKASFHTYQPNVLRSFRVVIRNLHHSTTCMEISAALSEEGHSVKQVINAKNKNKCALPIFFVDLNRQDNNNDIFNITSLFNTKVIIEKPHQRRRGPPQCYNCQAYGHTDNYCCHDPRCVKCGEDHRTEKCPKDRSTPAKCALCSEAHTANFKGCHVYQSIIKKRQKIKPAISQNNFPHFYNNISESLPKITFNSIPYASVASGIKPNINTQNSNLNVALSKFLSDLNSIINSFLSVILRNN